MKLSKDYIKHLVSNINKDFYNLETVKRGREYELTIYPLALNRQLTQLHRHTTVTKRSDKNCVYVYSITPKG